MSIPESESAAPLLRPRQIPQFAARQSPLVVILSRATGRRGPSLLVRETAAQQLEERRADWGYSMPVVLLDILWNAAFVVVSLAMLLTTTGERPNTPIRIWICGYVLQCLEHVMLVWLEYRRRNHVSSRRDAGNHDSEEDDTVSSEGGFASSLSRRCELLNTMTSFVWWIVGFYWVVSGGDDLMNNAPRLYWLTVVFLAFDVFFAIFCVALACLIGIALCCCLPCILAILYAVTGQDGASEADVSMLPKYKFQISDKESKTGKMVPVQSHSSCLSVERVLLEEDAECCICLSSYVDGTDLNALPCNHHFHSSCIVKWLKMNATCPLCKYNILKGHDII